MSFRVRELPTDDAVALRSLGMQLGYDIDERTVSAALATIVANPDVIARGAETADGLAGWIEAHETTSLQAGRFIEIGGLVVDEHHRSAGVGSALVDAVLAWADDRSVAEVRVRSNVVRSAAHAFYLAHGFALEKTSLTFRRVISTRS